MNNNVISLYTNNQYTYNINNNTSKSFKMSYKKMSNNISFKAKDKKNIFNDLLHGFQSMPIVKNYINWCKNKWNKLDDAFVSLANTKPMKKIINWASKKLKIFIFYKCH